MDVIAKTSYGHGRHAGRPARSRFGMVSEEGEIISSRLTQNALSPLQDM